MVFKPIYILILAGTIIVDYFAGIYIEKTENQKRKKRLLIASIVANVGVLCVFKYYNFINENISEALGIFHIENQIPMLEILLPIGLSFHTFQAMSYTIEVYRGKQKAEHHFGIYALYVMYYPQLVAGPIERPQNVIHQLKEKVYFNYDRVVDGLKFILWGMFIKVVIADRLSLYVDNVYAAPEHHSGITSLMAAFFFTIQIYCDFAGYSAIAIGSAKVLGVNLMTNFRRPYMSLSMREFWNRWHISLSSWFRDYIYFPMGGSKRGLARNIFNTLVIFFISGLWHGADYTFVIFGILHGVYIVLEIVLEKFLPFIRLPKFIKWLLTFSFMVFTLILIRSPHMEQAMQMFSNIFTWKKGSLYIGNDAYFAYDLLLILFLAAADYNAEKLNYKYSLIYNPHKVPRWIGYSFLILVLLAIGVINGGQFYYFQF